ncbi:hypothetical protein phytr_12050 [Candidatus Phycorickettsia trachydisci]|uniref:Uncharacterized protein n=1 Tax=Candidatus Phycorickettsia trachydisci TaxID=2115978 RepID=A0A2P1PA42_9RICK|nr:hypothetical protein [Candidatus Phycorickettsia trachydisci]AVP88130.1 hypothetical protein phytr_12050 [Candidatus Phycorickettsia trachydisci]
MTLYSYLQETYKQYDLDHKGRFLANAIKKANKDKVLLLNKNYWINVASELLNDPTVPTYYVPIREVIKCLEKGNLTLAIKLYLHAENNEVHNRAGELLNELTDTAQGNYQALEQIEEIKRSLGIITFIKNIQDLRKHGCSSKDIKDFTFYHWLEKSNLDDIDNIVSIWQTLDFILEQELNTKENILESLPHFRKIISNHHSNLLHEVVENEKLEEEILCARFPYDIIKSKDGGINIALTLGLAEDSFAELEEQNIDLAPDDYDKDSRVPPMINKKVYMYDSAKNIHKTNDAPPKLDEKSPSMKGSFFGRSLKNFFFGSVKNFVESPDVNIPNLHSANSYKISKLDLMEMDESNRDDNLSKLHTKFAEGSTNSSGLYDTVDIGAYDASRVNKLNKTLVFKNDEHDTHESSGHDHMKHLEAPKKPGLMQKFFSRSFKVAANDDVTQQKSKENNPGSFYRRGGISMKKMHDIEEGDENDLSIVDLYETYRQSQTLAQLTDCDEEKKDKKGVTNQAKHVNFPSKHLDDACAFTKDLDNVSDVDDNRHIAKDFLSYDAMVRLSGDIED